MFLLSMVVLTSNRNYISSMMTIVQTKQGLVASSVAQGRIERVARKYFDQATAKGVACTTAAQFSKIGVDAGEDRTKILTFNDMDDFNGYEDMETVMTGNGHQDIYRTRTRVCYVDSGAPFTHAPIDTNSPYRSWVKRVDVWVWPAQLIDQGSKADTAYMSQLVGFYKWR